MMNSWAEVFGIVPARGAQVQGWILQQKQWIPTCKSNPRVVWVGRDPKAPPVPSQGWGSHSFSDCYFWKTHLLITERKNWFGVKTGASEIWLLGFFKSLLVGVTSENPTNSAKSTQKYQCCSNAFNPEVFVEQLSTLPSSAGHWVVAQLKEKQFFGHRYWKHCLDKPVCCYFLCHNSLLTT